MVPIFMGGGAPFETSRRELSNGVKTIKNGSLLCQHSNYCEFEKHKSIITFLILIVRKRGLRQSKALDETNRSVQSAFSDDQYRESYDALMFFEFAVIRVLAEYSIE